MPDDSAPAAAATARPQRRRRTRWPLAILLVVIAVVIAGALMVNRHNTTHGPEALVRAYAEHLAAGRAAAASAMVAPAARDGIRLDPALLTDEVLGGATERIRDIEVSADPFTQADEAGDRAVVDLDYRLGIDANSVEMEVRRLPNTFGVLQHWRIETGLAVPVSIETNVVDIPAALIGEVEIQTSGPVRENYPQHRVLVYPASYRVDGVPSPWVTGSDKLLADHVRTAGTSSEPTSQVWYRATDALLAKVRTDLDAALRACAEAGARMKLTDCPTAMLIRRDWGTLRITQTPEVSEVQSFQSEYRAGGDTLPMLRFTTDDGEFSYSGGGRVDPGTERLTAQGGIYLSPDAQRATVEVWPDLTAGRR